jgi:hypothetical protein
MNPVFASKFPDRNPNATRVALTPADTREADGSRSSAADAPTGATVIPAMASASDEKPGMFDKIGSWLRRNPDKKVDPVPPPPVVASTPAPAPKTRTAAAPAPKPRHAPQHVTQTASAKPGPAEKPQKEAQQTNGTMQGAAPILNSSSFSAFR